MKKTIYLTLTGAILLSLIAGAFLYIGNSLTPTPQEEKGTLETISITLTIEGGRGNEPIAVSSDTTLLEVLQTLNTENSEIKLSTKEYAGMGTLIESIYGYKNGTDGKYWQYKVNGVMPQIGADKYILKAGDSVEWFFAASKE